MPDNIIGTLISTVGGVIAGFVSAGAVVLGEYRVLKRDSTVIAEIRNTTVENIKPDATSAKNASSQMVPLVVNLNETQGEQTVILRELYSDLDHRKRNEAAAGSCATADRDAAWVAINNLHTHLGTLQKQYSDALLQIKELSDENHQLKEQIRKLEAPTYNQRYQSRDDYELEL